MKGELRFSSKTQVVNNSSDPVGMPGWLCWDGRISEIRTSQTMFWHGCVPSLLCLKLVGIEILPMFLEGLLLNYLPMSRSGTRRSSLTMRHLSPLSSPSTRRTFVAWWAGQTKQIIQRTSGLKNNGHHNIAKRITTIAFIPADQPQNPSITSSEPSFG